MKKIFIIFSIFLYLLSFIPAKTFASTNNPTAQVAKIENEIFGFDFNNEGLNDRLARLEASIYGTSSKGNINERLKKIIQDLSAEQIGEEIPPSEDSFLEEETSLADNNVNYPIVDEIEMKLFNKTYKNRDFHTRIVTIERKLFGKIYDVEDYSTRMDRIKAEVMPERLAREKVFGYDNTPDYLSSNDLSGLNSSRYSTMPYGQENYTRPYTNYGDYTGGATPYTNVDIEEQLSQLENDTFGTEFSNDPTEMRLNRLNSVNKAKKSTQRYDSQKFNQRMSSVMEIGAMLLMILAMIL